MLHNCANRIKSKPAAPDRGNRGRGLAPAKSTAVAARADGALGAATATHAPFCRAAGLAVPVHTAEGLTHVVVAVG